MLISCQGLQKASLCNVTLPEMLAICQLQADNINMQLLPGGHAYHYWTFMNSSFECNLTKAAKVLQTVLAGKFTDLLIVRRRIFSAFHVDYPNLHFAAATRFGFSSSHLKLQH